ncbi:hypothetical protein BDAP_002366 [Binucleata daphniae]
MSHVEYILTKRTILNHNTFSIELISQSGIKKFPVSSFLYIYNQETKRPYTPIYVQDNKIILAIKRYPKGNLSNFLYNKEMNSIIKASEPILKKEYKKEYSDVLMIAGGTGITPMLQILDYDQTTHFLVLFCNLSENDIFLNDLLGKHKNVRIVHILEHNDNVKTCEDTQMSKKEIKYGKINKEILSDLAILENEILYDYTYVCGPPAFMEAVCGNKAPDLSQGALKGILKELKFDETKVYKF